MKKSLNFYNTFGDKLIHDYIFGNKRIESAIINLASFIPIKCENILDIGCGIGWSSHEFSKHFDKANIEGIDLSPVLINKASALFKRENLSFQDYNITVDLPKNQFDAIIMIDVYEHIPKSERNKFHEALRKILRDQSRLLLSCPTKFHQSWLKKNNPEGLQPVDENIDFEIITKLAQDIGGELIFFEYKKIWRNFDYLYAVIEIDPLYSSDYLLRSNSELNLEEPLLRKKRVQENLKIHTVIPEDPIPNRSIISRIKNKIKKLYQLF